MLIALEAVHRSNVKLCLEHPLALDGTHAIKQDGQKVTADVVIAGTGKYS